MKLLLDECTPRRLRREFPNHEVATIEQAGFKGLRNGALLRAAVADGFAVLLTVDKSIHKQQRIAGSGIALLVLRAHSNRYPDLKPLAPTALLALDTIKPGEVVIIAAPTPQP